MAGWTTLVQAETLAVALNRPDLAIVDCRFSLMNPLAGESAYLDGHIPGAVYAHLERDLSDMTPGGEGRHPWPKAETFTAKLGAWGIRPEHQIVAYDDGEGAHAARFWFLMRMLGHEKVAVLDAGWKHWTSVGLPVDSQVPKPVTGRYPGTFDTSRLLDSAQVQARLAQGEMLIDARAADRFRGENEMIDRIAGHVPGAVNRPYPDNLLHDHFKTPMQLADEFRALLGHTSPEQVMVMCGSGVTACHHLLAMERAGLRGARLYTGSWSGWITDPARPIATGEA
ncbi:thiosulfate sulfurtransferase [Lysobacter helvus]|uniref:Thiosulfate sulfurtransferase n=2 Tax=Lysobacteraceae TaxID=32033 RepID=A0ABN6FVB0_9GAMM|nr:MULTISPECIES: sulfurtransferase [Lysobacter]BCT93295.1 thiosulfate sulfurtransferase [Lysobacter caseinilyticus]BCT96448.1 thiosulfate sulfurtransferase [Lysobacter helvus]